MAVASGSMTVENILAAAIATAPHGTETVAVEEVFSNPATNLGNCLLL